MWASREWDSMGSSRRPGLISRPVGAYETTTGRQQVVCARAGRLVRSRAREALSHARDIARLSAVTSSQSPDAARLLPSRVDWLPGTFTCFSWELLVPAMWLSLHFTLRHVPMPELSVTPFVSSALAAPHLRAQTCISLLPAVSHKMASPNATHAAICDCSLQ